MLKLDTRRLPVLARDKINDAALPANYVAAKKALMECDNVDQVKDVSDKHYAIAQYAKQIKDAALLHHAERIYLRAQRRIGELLKELIGADRAHKMRKEVGEPFGISPAAVAKTMALAEIPEQKFEQALETSNPPPSASWLIRQSRKTLGPRGPQKTRDPYDWSAPYIRIVSMLTHFETALRECGCQDSSIADWPDAGSLAATLAPDEARQARERITKLIEWLDRFEQRLQKQSGLRPARHRRPSADPAEGGSS
jgi:hypothetical protein